MTTETQARGIATSMVAAARAVGWGVPKDGYNRAQNYRFASAAALKLRVGRALADAGVAVSTAAEILLVDEVPTSRGGTMQRIVVKMTLTFVDAASGEQMTAEGLGAGTDSTDKAVMKAATAAEKYAYIGALCLAMGEDPESDDEHGAPTSAAAPAVPAGRRAPAPSVAAKTAPARPQSSQSPQRAARTNGPAAPSDPGSLAAQLAAITAEAARDPQGATRRLEALCASTHLTSMPQTAKGRAWSGIRRAAAACGIEDPAAWFNRITTQEQQ